MRKLVALILSLIIAVLMCGCSAEDASSVLSGIIDADFLITEVQTVEEYYIVSPEQDACYNSLNKRQKEMYKIFYSAAQQMTDGFFRLCQSYDGVKTDIALAYSALLRDHTEIFWMPNVYLVSESKGVFSKDTVVSFDYSDNERKVSYAVTKEQRDIMKATLEEKVEEILKEAEKFNSDYEKEKFFNDYICQNTEYDKETELSHTSFSCLVLGKALCEGYSRAFKLLCNKAGIECDLIVGTADDTGHMWNSVNIDGKHSFVDVTWNDTENSDRYMYFNITGSQLGFDHEISPLYSELEESQIQNGNEFNYFERECGFIGNTFYARNGRYLEDNTYPEKAAKAIKEDSKTKRETVFLLNENQKQEFLNYDMGYISKIQKQLSGITIEKYSFDRDILVLFFSVYA